jgi:hypothetical protein
LSNAGIGTVAQALAVLTSRPIAERLDAVSMEDATPMLERLLVGCASARGETDVSVDALRFVSIHGHNLVCRFSQKFRGREADARACQGEEARSALRPSHRPM